MGFLCFGKKPAALPQGKAPIQIVPQLPTPSTSSLASRKPIPREAITPGASQADKDIPHYVKFNSSEPIFEDSLKPKVKIDPSKATTKASPPKPTSRTSVGGGYSGSSTSRYTSSNSYSGGGGSSSYGGGGDSGCSGGDSGGGGGDGCGGA